MDAAVQMHFETAKQFHSRACHCRLLTNPSSNSATRTLQHCKSTQTNGSMGSFGVVLVVIFNVTTDEHTHLSVTVLLGTYTSIQAFEVSEVACLLC